MIIQFLLITIEAICSVMLIGLILIQKAKGDGLGLSFGGGMGETLFGSRAGNVLTRLTIIFTVVFLVNTLLLAIYFANARERTLMGRFSAPAQAPRAVQPTAPAGAQRPGAPATAPMGAPTLPGASLEDQAIPIPAPSPIETPQPMMPPPSVSAPAESPAPQPAPVETTP